MNINWKKSLLVVCDIVIAAYLVMAVTAFNKPDQAVTRCTEVKTDIEANIVDGFLTVDEINSSEITFTSFLYGEQKKQTVRFGEELSEAVSSTFVIYDGINYSYVLTFSDKQP